MRAIDGIDHPSVLSYTDVVSGKGNVGEQVALISASGIGYDVSELLSHAGESASQNIPVFMKEWGIDMSLNARGGIEGMEDEITQSIPTIHLCQRKAEGLGKT
jgi:2,4-dienoyl-CoA reductase (NADPH2)